MSAASDAASYYAGQAALGIGARDELAHRLTIATTRLAEVEAHVEQLICDVEDVLADLVAMTADRDDWRDAYREACLEAEAAICRLPNDENDLTDDQVQRILAQSTPVTIELRPHTTAAGVAQVEASPSASLDDFKFHCLEDLEDPPSVCYLELGHPEDHQFTQVEASPSASLDDAGDDDDDLSPSPATTHYVPVAAASVGAVRANRHAATTRELVDAALADYAHRVATGKGYPDALTAAELVERYTPAVNTTLDTDPTAT